MSGAAYIDADEDEPLPEVNADRLLTLFLCSAARLDTPMARGVSGLLGVGVLGGRLGRAHPHRHATGAQAHLHTYLMPDSPLSIMIWLWLWLLGLSSAVCMCMSG